MPKKKSFPERTCVNCRLKAPKKELIRLVVKEGKIVLDEKGILPGRGAYLCSNCVLKKEDSKVLKKLKKALRLG